MAKRRRKTAKKASRKKHGMRRKVSRSLKVARSTVTDWDKPPRPPKKG